MDTPIKKTTRRYYAAHVVDYLKTRPNEVVTANEICTALELETNQVQTAINRAIASGLEIKIETKGQMWRYVGPLVEKPKEEPKKEEVADQLVYEYVGKTKMGIVVKDFNGKLYRLEAL